MSIVTLINFIVYLINIYSFVLIAYALMSWIPRLYGTWLGQIVIKLARPYLSLFQRLPLRFAGLDFSIIVALFALQIIQRFIVMVATSILF